MSLSSSSCSNRELNKKEILFCQYYIDTGNSKEAAMLSGYKTYPERKGAELLSDNRVKKKIEDLYLEKKKNLMYKATSGYERLAFGNISDSIKLLFYENLNPKDLDKMDLFNIAEIKKPKDGAMEIKFFDRIRALEKLEQINLTSNSEKEPFYYTLERSIKKLNYPTNSSSED